MLIGLTHLHCVYRHHPDDPHHLRLQARLHEVGKVLDDMKDAKRYSKHDGAQSHRYSHLVFVACVAESASHMPYAQQQCRNVQDTEQDFEEAKTQIRLPRAGAHIWYAQPRDSTLHSNRK